MRRSILALAILAFPMTAAAEVRTYRLEFQPDYVSGCGGAAGPAVWMIEVDHSFPRNTYGCPFTVSGSGPGGAVPFALNGFSDWDADFSWESFRGLSSTTTSGGVTVAAVQGIRNLRTTPSTLVINAPWDSFGVGYEADDCAYNTGMVTSITDITTSADADGDGIPDTSDACPGHDDRADADGDGTADGCDACPADATGDSDGDGVCDSQDPCPADVANDSDGDAVCDSVDACAGGDDLYDTDADGIPDDCDLCPEDPSNDADFDGVCGNDDACDGGDDRLDRDLDGTADHCDACPDDFYGDSDYDGACDSDDPCPLDNPDDPDQDGVCTSDDVCRAGDDFANRDHDGLADACDVCPDDAQNDVDGDGICGNLDNCAGVANPNQADTDHDGIGNACEPDTDGDGIIDDSDNCRMVSNACQSDADHDGIGDACEADTDHDGVIDDADRCPATPSGVTHNSTGCSLDQLAPCVGNWKNHGGYVSAYTQAANAFRAAGLLTDAQKGALTSAAAQLSCGKK